MQGQTMTAEAIRDLLPTLQLIPVLLGSGGTIAWIMSGLPRQDRPAAAPPAEGPVTERSPFKELLAEGNADAAFAAAHLEKVRLQAEFWDAFAGRAGTWGRVLAGRIAIVLYVAATVATVLNWQIAERLPPATPCT